jgi:hypothetical protein
MTAYTIPRIDLRNLHHIIEADRVSSQCGLMPVPPLGCMRAVARCCTMLPLALAKARRRLAVMRGLMSQRLSLHRGCKV